MKKLLHLPFALLAASALFSQNAEKPAAPPPSLFEFFQQQDSLPLLIVDTDWGHLIRKKREEEYQEGKLSFRNAAGELVRLDVKLRARGNVRKEVCVYPPIKIKLPKKQLSELGFDPAFKDLKLALSCQESKQYQECLAREALAYHLYEIVHPIHLKTKVVNIEGREGDKEKFSFYALLIEDEEEFAARLNSRVLGQGIVRVNVLNRDAYLKMCFFQYMIANVDWSVAHKHNLEFVQSPGFEKAVPVPYDFDYAGFIGTHYAVPAPTLPIKDVNERYFLGFYVTEEEAMQTAAYFRYLKEDILQCCARFPLLDERGHASAERYLSKFFEVIEDEKRIKREFVNKFGE